MNTIEMQVGGKTMSKGTSPKDSLERKEIFCKNHYFDNEIVERLLHRYLRGACTDVHLRDEIMKHASELIVQLIKAHNLAQIYPGKDDSSMMDLFQTAWIQIESALYKYEAFPYCAKCYNNMRPNESLLSEEYIFEAEIVKRIKKCPNCKAQLTESGIYYKGKSRLFNLWSQVARTVILAYIKKENRDRKNSDMFKVHVENKPIGPSKVISRFYEEAYELCKFNDEHLQILDALMKLHNKDERAHEGLIAKLMQETGLSRSSVVCFFRIIRLRCHDFSDSPVNEINNTAKNILGNGEPDDFEDRG